MEERNRDPQRHGNGSAHAARLLLGAVFALGASSVATRVHAQPACDDNDWPMYNHDAAGTRYNASERTLRASNVGGLHVLWQYPTPAPVSGTPVVADSVIYAGDMAGFFYALRSDGSLLWSQQLQGSVTASALVTDKIIVVGDISGNLYGLKRATGAVAWSMRPDSHPQAAIWGSPTLVDNHVAVGVASNEESAAGDPNYPCCSSRGSLVMLEPHSGTIIWQTYTVTDAERAAGASGSSIWSTPTYDAKNDMIYVTTGNNFTQPTNGTSDAFMAFNAHNGKIRWVNQRFPNDEWNFRFPYSPDQHPDADFGDSAQVYMLPNGRKVVGAGQKSGFYHVLDAKTGDLIQQYQFEVGGTLGGLFADSAVANGVVYANGVNWPAPGSGLPVAGDLFAFSGDASTLLWRFTSQFPSPYGTIGSPDLGGVAVANGVVYFTSWGFPSVGVPGNLFARDASTGAPLAQISLGTQSSTSGPSVSHGRVYVGTGDAIAAGFGYGVGPGSITAMGL
ncbi:MAG: PQQ-binding-like beta-propeller repeat protein [Polyangiales bacterium]